jgi:pimeloyl-ACP methyl ester carboxylesterase
MLFGLAGVDMPPTLLLLHGWGFDAGVWDGLVAALPGWPVLRGDLGYFGARAQLGLPQGPALAVGHSLGAMLLARALPAVPLVAINGFDRFCGARRWRRACWRGCAAVSRKTRKPCWMIFAQAAAQRQPRKGDPAALAEGLAALADESLRRPTRARAGAARRG